MGGPEMSEPNDKRLRDAGLAFLGRMVSVQTHEVTNAFSVINEMAGLQGDILEDAAAGEPLDIGELASVCEKIREHVKRGEHVVRSINWLAHTVDHASAVLNVEELLERIAHVAKSWMYRRQAVVELRLPGRPIHIETRPFFFAFAVLLGIDMVTDAPGEKRVVLDCRSTERGIELAISNRGSSAPIKRDRKLETMSSLARELKATYRLTANENSPDEGVVIGLPMGAVGEENPKEAH